MVPAVNLAVTTPNRSMNVVTGAGIYIRHKSTGLITRRAAVPAFGPPVGLKEVAVHRVVLMCECVNVFTPAVSPLERGGRRPGCVAVRDSCQQPHTPPLRVAPLQRGNTPSSVISYCCKQLVTVLTPLTVLTRVNRFYRIQVFCS